MIIATKNGHRSAPASENSFARKAFEEIQRIEDEAKQKKMEQLESLKSARAAILERITGLEHQIKQIDGVVASIAGRPALAGEKRARRNWDEDRARVGRWLQGRKGEKFAAADLVREFPELDGMPISTFLKPLIEAGNVKTDSTEGPKRTKYFAEA